jgi:adenine-specific DNA-methyltransferase
MRTPHLVILQRAAAMRAAPTTTESILWEFALRGSRMGVPFRRQFPVGRYIADFCAPRVRLVVEVDGGYHAGRARADARRDRDMARLGYRVLRLPAELVQHNLEQAVALVRAALAQQG